jgi:hypothetical protein
MIVEDGTGITAADSYVTLVEANAYASSSLNATSWAALGTDERERLLVAATRWLDQHAIWNGSKTFDTEPYPNNLRWPRKYVCDADNLPVGENAIPVGLRSAVVELAMFFLNPDNNPTAHSDKAGLSEITVDVITLRFQDGFNANSTKYLPGLNAMLRGLGRMQTANGPRGVPINKV